jgi:16S rRNA (adenine1518-N6/adenine1519-N6)-dimethyltransferase
VDTKALLRELNLRPSKGLGQNFLVDARVLEHVLSAAEVSPTDTVLEIGAGLGILTEALAQRACHVTAVEVDQRLISLLVEHLGTFANTDIVQGDILNLDLASLTGNSPYKVIANIPYYITSAILRRLLETPNRPHLLVLMVQREVAKRITAQPDEMSLLAVSVQFYGRPSIVAHVPAQAFYPAPKVDSAILRIDPYGHLPLRTDETALFFELVRAGFGQRRKQLHNALVNGLHLPPERVANALVTSSIDGRRRAETLQVAEWVTLHRALRPVTI